MSRITCAISGIRFNTSFLDSISIPHTVGYFHPIFAVEHKTLYHLYSKHCKGELTSNDSYLLFLAFLHSSGQVDWLHPVALNPNDSSTKRLIQNNLSQLISVLEKTGLISHPSFKQPSFNVTVDNCFLGQIPNWILAWESNILDFQQGRADIKTIRSLQEVENRLSHLILSGEKPERYAHVIASWAEQAADFPLDKTEGWKKTIRSCFSITKMFNTPLVELKEIKDFCECNIEVGSIHFHSLMNVLKEGIHRHVNYLGGSALALGYILLEVPPEKDTLKHRANEAKNNAELLTLAANAPESYPIESDYPTSLAFLKAKLAYRVASSIRKEEKETLPSSMSDTIPSSVEILDPIECIEEINIVDNNGDIL